jgi:serine/threonine protein kinase
MLTKSDPISDVFSAGLIFHYLLLGKSIFPGKKYNEILTQNRACNFDFAQSQYKEINSHAVDLLKKMLEKDPSKRITAKKALCHQFFTNSMDVE